MKENVEVINKETGRSEQEIIAGAEQACVRLGSNPVTQRDVELALRLIRLEGTDHQEKWDLPEWE